MKKLLNYFHIALNLSKMTISELVSFAFGIKTTGDPDVNLAPFTDIQIQVLAGTVQNDLGSRATDPSPKLTAKEQQDVDALSRAVMANKNYAETAANAKAMGNKAVFDNIVKRIGFAPTKDRELHPRSFEEVETGIGWTHIRAKKARKGNEAHAWRYGVTTARDIPPAVLGKTHVTLEADAVINLLKSGSIYGIQHASIVPVSHNKKTSDVKTVTGKQATMIPVSKAKHPIINDNDDLNWSGFIYVVIL